MGVPTHEELPAALVDRPQWVCWRVENRSTGSDPTKVPVDPETDGYASTTDPSTWSSFQTAREHAVATDVVDGIGVVFSPQDPFVGVDLDDCRDPETNARTERATAIIDRLDSYTEVSPSGTGSHVIVQGDLPEGRNRRSDVEMYDTGRYFTVTGDYADGTPETVSERTTALTAVHDDYVVPDGSESSAPDTGSRSERKSNADTSSNSAVEALSDEALLERAKQAANGEQFTRLWNGSTAGYESHSEADMALCCHLAFWTGGDAARIDRLVRRSGLSREKWDEVHYADGRTYGEVTLQRAIDRVDDAYDSSMQGEEAASQHVEPDRTPEDRTAQQTEATSSAGTTATRPECRLKATIERFDDRIDELEAENERLQRKLRAEREARAQLEACLDERGSDDSLWRHVLRILK